MRRTCYTSGVVCVVCETNIQSHASDFKRLLLLTRHRFRRKWDARGGTVGAGSAATGYRWRQMARDWEKSRCRAAFFSRYVLFGSGRKSFLSRKLHVRALTNFMQDC